MVATDGDRIGLEQVGGHAGAVADVVAHVVGDRRGVARVVLGNAGLDLADQVGADIGALGEDAAAEPGEDRDQRGAEASATSASTTDRGWCPAMGRSGRSNSPRRRAGRSPPPACR